MITTEVNFSLLRHDFPIFKQVNRGKPLIYLDSAASAQKPRQVIDAMNKFYCQDYANIHRGIYELCERSTHYYDKAREQVKDFIGATHKEEIIFVKGTTEGINLVAQSYGRSQLQAGDEILLSVMEHHSNIVPWYQLQEQMGVVLKIVPITEVGEIDVEAYKKLFSSRTKLVAISHVSNVLGTINPAKTLTSIAHEKGVPILLDGAQAVPHIAVNVKEIDCDFYVFSGHKLYGPTGIGVLFGKKKWLESLPPYQGGGDMIESVAFDKVIYAPLPNKFEAGTPNIAGAIGLGEAISHLQKIGMPAIMAHEQALLHYAESKLKAHQGLRIIGHAKSKIGVISFVMEGIHPHDLGTVLDQAGIAVRAGHHCAMPLMAHYCLPATLRVSFGLYNNENDVDALISAMGLAKRLLS